MPDFLLLPREFSVTGSDLHCLFTFPGAKLPRQIVLIEIKIEAFGYAGALTMQPVDDIP